MNPGPSQNWPLTPAQLAALQSALAEYESGWVSGASPSIEPHLVDDPAVRPALLAELVLSDPITSHLADSMEVGELVMQFEETFGLTIPDEDYEKIHTIQDALRYSRKRRQSN